MKAINNLLFILLVGCISQPIIARKVKWELGASHGVFAPMAPESFKKAGSSCGIKWVEATVSNLSAKTDEQSRAYFSTFAKSMKGSRMKWWSVYLPFASQQPNDLSVNDSVWRNETMIRWLNLLDIAKTAGKFRVVVFHPSSEAKISEQERLQRLNNLKQMLLQFAPMVKKRYGAIVAVENLPRACLGNTSNDLLWLVEQVPGLKVCFDTNHCLQEKPEVFATKLAPHIVTLHVSDYDFLNERHWLPGNGKINWNAVIHELVKGGYTGPFLYETSIKNDPEAQPQILKKNMAELFNRYYISQKK